MKSLNSAANVYQNLTKGMGAFELSVVTPTPQSNGSSFTPPTTAAPSNTPNQELTEKGGGGGEGGKGVAE